MEQPPRMMSLADVLARLGLQPKPGDEPAEPLILTETDGRPAAVLMSHDYYESLMETLDTLSDPEEVAAIQEGMEAIKRGDVVSYEEAFGEPQPVREPAAPEEPPRVVALTAFERSVLQQIALGRDCKEIAQSANVPLLLVKGAINVLMEKLGITGRAGESGDDVKAEDRPAFKTGR